jgi:hypothetical protein
MPHLRKPAGEPELTQASSTFMVYTAARTAALAVMKAAGMGTKFHISITPAKPLTLSSSMIQYGEMRLYRDVELVEWEGAGDYTDWTVVHSS